MGIFLGDFADGHVPMGIFRGFFTVAVKDRHGWAARDGHTGARTKKPDQVDLVGRG
jgi:hypothetical protein